MTAWFVVEDKKSCNQPYERLLLPVVGFGEKEGRRVVDYGTRNMRTIVL